MSSVSEDYEDEFEEDFEEESNNIDSKIIFNEKLGIDIYSEASFESRKTEHSSDNRLVSQEAYSSDSQCSLSTSNKSFHEANIQKSQEFVDVNIKEETQEDPLEIFRRRNTILVQPTKIEESLREALPNPKKLDILEEYSPIASSISACSYSEDDNLEKSFEARRNEMDNSSLELIKEQNIKTIADLGLSSDKKESFLYPSKDENNKDSKLVSNDEFKDIQKNDSLPNDNESQNSIDYKELSYSKDQDDYNNIESSIQNRSYGQRNDFQFIPTSESFTFDQQLLISKQDQRQYSEMKEDLIFSTTQQNSLNCEGSSYPSIFDNIKNFSRNTTNDYFKLEDVSVSSKKIDNCIYEIMLRLYIKKICQEEKNNIKKEVKKKSSRASAEIKNKKFSLINRKKMVLKSHSLKTRNKKDLNSIEQLNITTNRERSKEESNYFSKSKKAFIKHKCNDETKNIKPSNIEVEKERKEKEAFYLSYLSFIESISNTRKNNNMKAEADTKTQIAISKTVFSILTNDKIIEIVRKQVAQKK